MIQQSLCFPVDDVSKEEEQLSKKIKELSWIKVAADAPYFITEEGNDWTPIGQNDAITWPELKGIFMRKDLSAAENYFKLLKQHGVTCLRLMLEYCHGNHRYFENPVGTFKPAMVRMWDDIFALCEKFKLRILLTPYDTFWMWIRWAHHPYNKKNSGICDKRSQWLLCQDTRDAIKQRLAFATERWGGSGALFAWDLWNEIHPAHGNNSAEGFWSFIEDISSFLRETEFRLHGKAHPQTVSVFGPVLENNKFITDSTYRHSHLDFASVHFYESGTIDHPKNTIDAAISTGRLTGAAINNIEDNRPFFDSEHGPIHSFKDKKKTLVENFDDEYFRHMQWAHFASGGAGGGMRWPNRHPHSLTPGMRKAQYSLSCFLLLINWQQFNRKNLNNEVILSDPSLSVFCCADNQQAVLWLLRVNSTNKKGMVTKPEHCESPLAKIPGMEAGNYNIIMWNTEQGSVVDNYETSIDAGMELLLPPIEKDLAIAIRKIG